MRSVKIVDLEQDKALNLNTKDKKAGWNSHPNSLGQYGFSGPIERSQHRQAVGQAGHPVGGRAKGWRSDGECISLLCQRQPQKR